MYKRILAAVDRSLESQLALAHAVMLAKQGGAQLRLICVIDEYAFDASQWETPSSHAAGVVKKRADAQRVLEDSLHASGAGVAAEVAVVEIGKPPMNVSEAIVADAARWRADLLVLGTHGRKGLDRIVLGSVAEGVARSAPAPVLLVRNGGAGDASP